MHLIGSLISFPYATLRKLYLMDLTVMMADRPTTVFHITRFCVRITGDTSCIVGMALGDLVLLPQELGDIPISLIDRDIHLGAESGEQRLAHDTHKSCVFHRATALFLPEADFALMQEFVTGLAKSNQVVWRIATAFPALQVVDVQFNGVLPFVVGAAALASVVIAL